MKFSINASELQSALTVVAKGAATRSTMPVLGGILVRAQDDRLTLEATNLDLSIRRSLPALIEAEGQTVIPSRLFTDVMKSLPDSAVHVQTDEASDQVTILCETSSFSLKTLDPQDFPGFPRVEETTSLQVPFAQFSRMVRRVAKVASRDESRAILTGVLVEAQEGTLRMVATDSYRLAVTETPFDGADADFTCVIAASFMQDLASLPEQGELIELALAENQIVARYADTTFVARRIEGNFPRYGQLIPEGYETRATFDVRQLADAVKRTSLLANKTAPVKIDLNDASQTALVSTASQDIGAASETIHCDIEGVDTVIAFNFGFVSDGLSIIEGDQAVLDLQGSMKPGIFRQAGQESFLYLIMPVRI